MFSSYTDTIKGSSTENLKTIADLQEEPSRQNMLKLNNFTKIMLKASSPNFAWFLIELIRFCNKPQRNWKVWNVKSFLKRTEGNFQKEVQKEGEFSNEFLHIRTKKRIYSCSNFVSIWENLRHLSAANIIWRFELSLEVHRFQPNLSEKNQALKGTT